MEERRDRITVQIAGKAYTFVGRDSESEEKIRRVAILVDRRITEQIRVSNLDQPRAAVLTAMNLAEELIDAQDENTRLRRELLEIRGRRQRTEKKE